MDVLGDTTSIDNGVDSRNSKRVTLAHDKEVGSSEGGTEGSELRDGYEEKVEQHLGRFVLMSLLKGSRSRERYRCRDRDRVVTEPDQPVSNRIGYKAVWA